MEDYSLQLPAARDGEIEKIISVLHPLLVAASSFRLDLFAYSLQSEVEEDILKTMQRLQDSVNNLDQTGTCQVDPECASSFKELVQVRRGLD